MDRDGVRSAAPCWNRLAKFFFERKGTYSPHGWPEAVRQLAQGAEVLLEALQLQRRCLLDAARRRGRGRRHHLLLETPHVGPHHQQEVAEEQLDDLRRKESDLVHFRVQMRRAGASG